MKSVVFLVTLFCTSLLTAQNFSKEWKKIYQLEKEGSYKTVSGKVEGIYEQAIKGKNEVQILKTFFYRQKLAEKIGTPVSDVAQIEKEIGLVSEKTQLFYYLITANDLTNELINNLSEINKRTGTTKEPAEKPKSEWTKEEFLNEIKRLQDLTFTNKSLLFQSVKPYEEVILIKDEQNGLFETYFEFFTMEWINLYHSLEGYGLITSLEELNIPTKVLDLSDDFYNTDFTENGLQAIKLYQQLEQYYLQTKNNYLLDKVRYNRLKKHIYNVDGEARYLLYNYFIENAQTKHFIDKVWFDLAVAYSHKRTEESFGKADELLKVLLENNPDEFITKDALTLQNEIHRKTISLTAPSYAHTDELIKMRANYRNTDSLYSALYLISDEKTFNSIEHPLDFDEYRKNNYVKEVIVFFPMRNFKKYIENITEIFIPKQQGNYILAYHPKDFIIDKTIDNVSFVKIKVTYTVVLSKIKNREIEFLIYDRKTGQPLKNGKVKIDGKRITTNDKGKIVKKKQKLSKKINRYSYTDLTVEIPEEDYTYIETFSIQNFHYYFDKQEFEEEEEVQAVWKLFTDRGLYRPGHKVHFKGVAFNQYEYKKSEVVENIRMNLVVKDASINEIYSSEVITNQWGSFSGSFKIPQNTSLGRFKIYLEEPDDLNETEEELWESIDFYDDELVFWVEEYKRPTFEVQTDEFTETLKADTDFYLIGKAMSFAKSPIANAKITAKITVSKAYQKMSSEQIALPEISTHTNADGTFKIPFKMIVSDRDQIENKPYHTYSFEIDVQDETGEVRSTAKNIYYSYNDLSVKLNALDYLDKRVPLHVNITAQTANGKTAKVRGKLKVLLVNDYESYYKKRLWQAPENQLLNEATFKNLFPYERFTAKDWNDKQVIYQQEIEVDGNAEIDLPTEDWKTGYYDIAFLPDEEYLYSFTIRKGVTFQIQENYKDNETIVNLSIDKDTSVKQNKVVFNSSSAFDDVYVNVELIDAKGISEETQFLINKGKSAVTFENIDYSALTLPVQIQYHYVYDNRVYKQTTGIPYRVADINNWVINAEQINNKLTPSEPYHWKFKVTSDTQNVFKGEVLASMYDISIDRLIKGGNLSEWDFSTHHYINSRYDLPKVYFNPLINYAELNYSYYLNYSPLEFKSHILFNTLNWFGYGDYERKKEYEKFIENQLKDDLKDGYIRSKIVDEEFGDFLPDVKVTNKTTGKEVFTNKMGEFIIKAQPMDEILFEAEDRISQRIFAKNISSSKDFIQMRSSDDFFLEEIVVDSYKTFMVSNPNSPVVVYDVQSKEEKEDYVTTLKRLFNELNVSKNKNENEGYGYLTIQTDDKLSPLLIIDGIPASMNRLDLNEIDITQIVVYKDAGAIAIYGNRGVNGAILITTKKSADLHESIILRKKLQETAFFFPHMETDNGHFELNFTAPESLTEWKFRVLAHNQQNEFAYFDYNVNTQKDVMIQPNMPRFVRETDEVVLKARVSNTTGQPLNATAMLRLFNTITGEELSDEIIKTEKLVPVTIEGLSANAVSWTVRVPKNIEGLQYRISVQSGNFTDGEESVIPVLSNRQLVTETVPIWQLANENKSYQLTNLLENTSATLENHQLRIDVSNNATWLMMQSLPYLLDYPHQCSEQLFARYFANVIASNVLENNPSIQQLVKEWKENPKSKLEENEELKQILLQETPWMKDLVSDEEQKAQLAHYFDVNRLDYEAKKIEDILTERQLPSGALPWFSGGNENPYITAHILVTIAQLKNLGIQNPFLNNTEGFMNKAHRYLDVQFEKKFKNKQEPSFSEVIDYAFVKSYYKDSFAVSKDNQARIDRRLEALKKDWVRSEE